MDIRTIYAFEVLCTFFETGVCDKLMFFDIERRFQLIKIERECKTKLLQLHNNT